MARIIGTGMYVPKTVVKNEDITDNPSWVEDNTGIKERRICGNNTYSSGLGRIAGKNAMRNARLRGKDIDMLIVTTATPDKIAPSTACLIAKELNLTCPAFDINAVCSGFLYGMYIVNKMDGNILVIGVDTFSKITDWSERDCVFFGDGAGAVVFSGGDNFKSFFIASDHYDNGFTCEHEGMFQMNGHDVFRRAEDLVPGAINRVLKDSGLSIDQIDYMVPHQPSKLLLHSIADIIGLSREKVLMNMDRYANTSAATIPILLHESWSKFKEGDLILFAAIGSGWTYGACVYEV